MSRTKHMTYAQFRAYGTGYLARSKSPRRARARAPSRLTPPSNSNNFHPYPRPVLAMGNQWGGTVSSQGGDARRRRDRDARESKILGRRLDRRRRNREIGSDE